MTLELILGPMFCGKTSELIRLVEREIVVDKEVVSFKPEIDKRYSINDIASHAGGRLMSIPVDRSSEMYGHVKPTTEIISIDEIQFFDEGVIDFCIKYANNPNVLLIASGLNLDFRRKPFKFRDSEKHIGELMPYARITNLSAKCTYTLENGKKCDRRADYTQKFVDGAPAPYDSPLVLVSEKKDYAARCLKHHIVPGRDTFNIHYQKIWKK